MEGFPFFPSLSFFHTFSLFLCDFVESECGGDVKIGRQRRAHPSSLLLPLAHG